MNRKILTGQGNPLLRGHARTVNLSAEDELEELAALVTDLRDTMADHGPARGLSAPQIGVVSRVFVIAGFPQAFVNPELVSTSTETVAEDEGCFSLPGVFVSVRRPKAIRFRASDELGRERVFKLRGRDARTAQHELDHLDGVLITDHGESIERTYRNAHRLHEHAVA